MAGRKPPRHGSETFVERHGLWDAQQVRAARAVEQAINKHKLELVRFSFADQHGILRGKTVVAADAPKLMRAGVTMTTTLLAKDTSHKTVFPVFTAGGGFGMDEMEGGGDFVMVADPATFRVLPWAEKTGWLLCDIHFTNGKPVPFSTRALARAALGKLSAAGYDFLSGLEVEFHLFKLDSSAISPADATWPPAAPEISLTTAGYQYLTESRFDQVEPILDLIRRGVQALDLPLRSIEVELGPSQFEFTFRPQTGLASADTMMLFRSAAKQIARRHGYVASFMCRPALANLLSCGWHLHQSLTSRKTKANVFVGQDGAMLSETGRHYLGGLLAHARAGAAFATPTINGYKRYKPYSLAPDRAIWARDNRGVMIRVIGQPGDPATHLENRVGEPAANPYLYLAAQIHAGLDGVTRKLEPDPSADTPYETNAPMLPKNLGEALSALREDECFRASFGKHFVDYYAHIKDAEIARFRSVTGEAADGAEVTPWEHKEYLELF